MTPASAPPPATRRRASPRPPQDRRRLLVDTTIELVRARHELPSTREFATAAGIAAGTLFRVFDTKDALVDAHVALLWHGLSDLVRTQHDTHDRRPTRSPKGTPS